MKLKIWTSLCLSSITGVKLKIGEERDFNKGVLFHAVEEGRLTKNFAHLFSLDDEEGDSDYNMKFGMLSLYANYNLESYGCWCRSADWTHGKGQPVDVFDELCRQQHHNYDCLAMEDQHCDPTTVQYSFDLYFRDGNVLVECSNDLVNESCQAKTCMIDIQIVSQYVEQLHQFVYPAVFDFGHVFFDPEVECPRGTPSDREKVCCGTYPFREWFLKNGDVDFRDRECCEYDDSDSISNWGPGTKKGRYYDSSIEICCANGSGVNVIGGRC